MSQKFHSNPPNGGHHGSRKSQVSLVDLMLAFTIFTVIIIYNYYLWGEVSNKILNTEFSFNFEKDLRNVVESLISMKGEPHDWGAQSIIDDSTISTLGLAGAKNELDNSKLAKLKETSYYLIENLILPSGKIKIEISNSTHKVYEYGIEPYGLVIRVDRLVIINDSVYRFTVKGWRG